MKTRGLFLLALASALAACSNGQAEEAPARDFSSAIALRDAGACRFDPLTEHAFEGLMLLGWPPDDVTSAPIVALGESRFTPQFRSKPMQGAPDGHEYSSHLDLPAGSTWHGLPIERMWVEFIAPPETDSLYRRGLTFRASPQALQRTLASLGSEVPLSPDFRALDENALFSSATCGGAIMIEPADGGASLVCDRGC